MTITVPHWVVAIVGSWPFTFVVGALVASAFWAWLAAGLAGWGLRR